MTDLTSLVTNVGPVIPSIVGARKVSGRNPDGAFFGVSALLFAASAALTIAWCESTSAMGGMPMPGGWTMSMAWMRMPGQTWLGAAASFRRRPNNRLQQTALRRR